MAKTLLCVFILLLAGMFFLYPVYGGTTTNLVGWWKFDEASSGACTTTVIDSSVSNNPGTCVGSPTYMTGHIGKGALTFTGTPQDITTNYTQTAVTAYTITAWVNTTTATKQSVIVSDRGSGAGDSLTLSIGGAYPGAGGPAGDVAFGLDSNTIYIGCYSTAVVNNGSWHFLAGVWSGDGGGAVAVGQFSVYIDGAKAAVTTLATGAAPNGALSGLGGTVMVYHQAWATYFVGSLDDVRIYTRALSAAEIRKLYIHNDIHDFGAD